MNKSQQLIVQKYIGPKEEFEKDDYKFYLRRTIKQNEGLNGDEVRGFCLRAGKGYPINDH
jgi:hypothetical protein